MADCEFKEKPSKGIQNECPVCLLVLRDPYQATCCGYTFCRVCIERVRADNRPCPCCNARAFNCFEDKRLKRSLNDFKVHCANKRLCCRWVGELGELESHLNYTPSQDKQLEGCQFTQVQCLHCSEHFQRASLEVHQNDQCFKRPFSCDYCKDYDSTYEDVATNHWPVCAHYPMQCPNKCSYETIERQNIYHHVTSDCPLTVVDCDFKHVGCEVRLPRKDLSAHLTENLVAHVSLQTKQLMDLEMENKQLKHQVEELQQQVGDLTKDLFAYQVGTPVCPVEITMTNFEQHKQDCDKWYSPPFYTHIKGYKMCLYVYAGGMRSTGVNAYISPFLMVMRGKYDDQLQWPLRGKFTIQLQSQNHGDERHHSESISLAYDDSTPDMYCSRVVHGEQSDCGWGCPTFVAHTELKPKYLQNDCLKFYVKKVE